MALESTSQCTSDLELLLRHHLQGQCGGNEALQVTTLGGRVT